MKKDNHKARPARQQTSEAKTVHDHEDEFPLSRENYILLAICFGIVILGFILMIGQEDIYDFRKRTLAPILVIGGFISMVYAIMKKPKQ